MDLNIFEHWNHTTFWGALFIGVLGNIIAIIILNIVGKATKRARFWIYYKEGNSKMLERMKSNPYYVEMILGSLRRYEKEQGVFLIVVILLFMVDLLIKNLGMSYEPILRVMIFVSAFMSGFHVVRSVILSRIYKRYLDYKIEEHDSKVD